MKTVRIDQAAIDIEKIRRAINCLIDSGFEADAAETAIQALCHILFDIETEELIEEATRVKTDSDILEINEYDPTAYYMISFDNNGSTEYAAWNETRLPKNGEHVECFLEECFVDGEIIKVHETDKDTWYKYYIAHPLENRTKQRAHDNGYREFMNVRLDGREENIVVIWKDLENIPEVGDTVCVVTQEGTKSGIVIEDLGVMFMDIYTTYNEALPPKIS